MSLLLESIKVKENKLYNLSYHLKRINRSVASIYNSPNHPVRFNELQQEALRLDNKTLYKLRIVYDDKSFEYSFLPYKIRRVKSLQLVEDDTLDYSHKYVNRLSLENLFAKKGKADDILITSNGSITDSIHCNVAFKRNGQWFTPDMPLLEGTKRNQLIDELVISSKEIYIEDIPDYEKVCLFNSMIDFGEIVLPTKNILF